MHYFLDPLSAFVTSHSVFAYGVLFFFIFLEGEIAIIMGGVLTHIGVLQLGWTLAIVIVAATLKTFIGYHVGAYIGRKFPNNAVLKYIERKVYYFLPRFRERPFWSIVMSKCIYGVNNATLVFAGYVGVDFKTYLRAEIVSSIIWLGGLFGLGLFFSSTALTITHNFRTFSLLVVLFILAFVVLLKMINLVIEVIEEWHTDLGKPDVQ